MAHSPLRGSFEVRQRVMGAIKRTTKQAGTRSLPYLTPRPPASSFPNVPCLSSLSYSLSSSSLPRNHIQSFLSSLYLALPSLNIPCLFLPILPHPASLQPYLPAILSAKSTPPCYLLPSQPSAKPHNCPLLPSASLQPLPLSSFPVAPSVSLPVCLGESSSSTNFGSGIKGAIV